MVAYHTVGGACGTAGQILPLQKEYLFAHLAQIVGHGTADDSTADYDYVCIFTHLPALL